MLCSIPAQTDQLWVVPVYLKWVCCWLLPILPYTDASRLIQSFCNYRACIWFCFSRAARSTLLRHQEPSRRQSLQPQLDKIWQCCCTLFITAWVQRWASDTIGCRMTTDCHLPSRPIVYQFGSLSALPPILTGAASFGCAWQVWYTPSYPEPSPVTLCLSDNRLLAFQKLANSEPVEV